MKIVKGHNLSHYGDTNSDIMPHILAINTMGNNLIGLELGVFKGDSFLTILHNCNNVKKLYGVDNWKPYYDFLKPIISYTCVKTESASIVALFFPSFKIESIILLLPNIIPFREFSI